ncbi:glycosyltransferase family 4 protein [Lichenifustis flavocetrariae]|uniref:Glycosyltransferase family 4 protein n=1 Tax=Lichenifustis flavocetrariae TaxID=2949735 RepID=A0AA42CLB7_9HYPH|nr:glycosyltransferase family 4 protein [Lichenifustis flavocetrariae]MCW6511433.1 glycosyltransferase family 4 protein [Lichenifustis flavocetrariae]
MTKRSYLFIHQNMPAQFLHLCRYLKAHGHDVAFITKNQINQIAGVTKVMYPTPREAHEASHPYVKSLESAVLYGQAAFRSVKNLEKHGFKPDIIVGHAGWGETLFVKDAAPRVPLLTYFEFFFKAIGQDVGFDPEQPPSIDAWLSLRIRNSVALLSNHATDWGLTPTQWQFSTHPNEFRQKMSVIHEGIDTNAIRPNPEARFILPDGRELRPGQKIVTFVARNLEPYRGFHIFMRALPEIQRRHPDAEILIVGQEGVSYGRRLPEGDSYKKRMLAEVSLDLSKIHFTGHLATPEFRAVMHVSAAHVYLTYPFVLSWSMLEAMASECLVIGSRTAPVEEVIEDGHNGLLVDFFDVAGLADRVNEALSKPERFRDLRRAARNTVLARYDLQSVCLPRQLALIENLIASGPGRGD